MSGARALLLFFILCFCSCGQQRSPDGMPELVPFDIEVIQDGKPLEGANVRLKGQNVPYLVEGITDSNGKACLKTQGKYQGAPIDQYVVTVTKNVETPSKYDDNPPEDDDLLAQWNQQRAREYRPTHCYVQKKFGDPKTSGLSVSVVANGHFKIDVGKAVDDIRIPKGTAPAPKK